MNLPTARDKILFTPGPLTTSLAVKQAMLRDAGSWHFDFNAKVTKIRQDLLDLAHVSKDDDYECILLQGSGTFGVESIFSSAIPPTGKVLVISNGAYGNRMAQMLRHLKIKFSVHATPEDKPPDLKQIEQILQDDAEISHVAVVHCETTTGILNPIQEIGALVARFQRSYIVDAMSSFGSIRIDLKACHIDYLVSCANKCIEGVPGFSFIIARREPLLANEGNSRSLSLDLIGQLRGFDANSRFRFSPPTHSLLAFEQALKELELEGGIDARGNRYRHNHAVLLEGMHSMGFRAYLPKQLQSYIITAFHYPEDTRFDFDRFYRGLSDRGMIIYPGKISEIDLFRIGTIGRIFEPDINALLAAVESTLTEMGVTMKKPSHPDLVHA